VQNPDKSVTATPILADHASHRAGLREIFQRTVRPGGAFLQFARFRLSLYEDFRIERHVDRLVERGIALQTLAIAMLFLHLAPRVDGALRSFGDKRSRQKKANALRAPIEILKEFQFLEEGFPEDQKVLGGMVAPSLVTDTLEHYAFIVESGDLIRKVAGISSLGDVVKYGFALSVHEITGKYLDKQVSAITGAAFLDHAYDETSHRVWRTRSSRLAAPAAFVADVLVVLNEVVQKQMLDPVK